MSSQGSSHRRGIGGIDLIGQSANLFPQTRRLTSQKFIISSGPTGTGKFLKDSRDTQHILKKPDELAAFIKDYRARINRPIYFGRQSAAPGSSSTR